MGIASCLCTDLQYLKNPHSSQIWPHSSNWSTAAAFCRGSVHACMYAHTFACMHVRLCACMFVHSCFELRGLALGKGMQQSTTTVVVCSSPSTALPLASSGSVSDTSIPAANIHGWLPGSSWLSSRHMLGWATVGGYVSLCSSSYSVYMPLGLERSVNPARTQLCLHRHICARSD